VGTGSDTVTLAKATITGDTSKEAVLDGTANSITLVDTNTLALADTGTITIAGNGKIVAGATTFSGVGVWTAGIASGTVETITITSADAGATIALVKSTGTATAGTLTASGTAPTITQAAGASNNLTIAADTTVALGGTGAKVGEIVLKNSNESDATNNGKLTLLGTITTGNATASVAAAPLSDDSTTEVTDASTYTKIGVENLIGDGTTAVIEPTNAPDSGGSTSVAGNIVKLTGTASGVPITGGDTSNTDDGSVDGKISGETETVEDAT
jgi:hypothetical protein